VGVVSRSQTVVRQQLLPLGEGGEAETLFRLDGWGTSQISSPWGKMSGHFLP